MRTARLVLRRFRLEDAGFALELLNDPAFLAGIGDKEVRTLEGARRYLEIGPLASYREHGFGLWHVALVETGVPVGMAGLVRRAELPDPDLGYAILTGFHRRGYGFEAAKGVLEFAETELGLTSISAVVGSGNEPSIRLLTQLGFSVAGQVRLGETAEDVDVYRRS